MLQEDDMNLIRKKGISPETLERQLNNFRQGFPFIRLLRPAVRHDGIISLPDSEKNEFIRFFENHVSTLRLIKFVPASGAASRMFKHLFEFRESLVKKAVPGSFNTETDFNSANYFITNLPRFAFYHDLELSLEKEGKKIEKLIADKDFAPILEHLLMAPGLNYSSLPKALLAFHSYDDGQRTAMEEHLVEAVHYSKDSKNFSRIHFTLSPEHIEKFDRKIAAVRNRYETKFGTHFDISHSIQKTSTDTIAVDNANQPIRNADGSILFRPAGHGALLSNLNDLKTDIIFIKNIDNVVPDRLKAKTIEYKKLIGGYLLFVRNKIFGFLQKANSGRIASEEIREMSSFAVTQKLVPLPDGFESLPEESQCTILARELNRPIRVCGMVKNEGEPGGGPFWVVDKNGHATLQIVESSQVDMKDEAQNRIFCASTHFNPVDLVCCTIDYQGNPFDLQQFVDTSAGLITLKSSGGRIVKAQELPGLWNGSMSGWITLFVEVPLITFNPVKTINDLLRDEHQ